MKQPVYQNYEPLKVNQQPNFNMENKGYENAQNTKKIEYGVGNNYSFFKNTADSHKHNYAYTPNPINPDAIK